MSKLFTQILSDEELEEELKRLRSDRQKAKLKRQLAEANSTTKDDKEINRLLRKEINLRKEIQKLENRRAGRRRRVKEKEEEKKAFRKRRPSDD